MPQTLGGPAGAATSALRAVASLTGKAAQTAAGLASGSRHHICGVMKSDCSSFLIHLRMRVQAAKADARV